MAVVEAIGRIETDGDRKYRSVDPMGGGPNDLLNMSVSGVVIRYSYVDGDPAEPERPGVCFAP